MEKKYEILLDISKEINGRTVYRIKALKDFGDVEAGYLGGYIEKEYNLSHEGNCWVYDNACVYEEAEVCDDAKILDNAQVYGEASVYHNAEVSDYAKVYGEACVYEEAQIFDNAEIYEAADVHGFASVYGFARIRGGANVYGDSYIYEYAEIFGLSRICGDVYIIRDAYIGSDEDYAFVHGFGSENRTTTFFRLKNSKDIGVKCGCFIGTLKEFKKKVRKRHGRSKYAKEYLHIIKAIETKFRK